MPVTAIIPAYNEAGRIGAVLESIAACPLVSEILVVDDGSQDGTGDVAARHPGVRVLRVSPNRGKAAAMFTGASRARNRTVTFFDADLVGLSPRHVETLVRPVLEGKAEMSVGQFRGGRGHITFWQRLLPAISGQRAMRREDFLAFSLNGACRFGVEIALTRLCRRRGLRTCKVPLRGVTHVTKEEKTGWVRGVRGRIRMYLQMARALLLPLR